MLFKTLADVETEKLRQAFLEAFSDYSVPVDMPIDRFQTFLKGNGFVPELSIGAFEGHTLCGFIINGVREWQGVLTAYDGGTGVVPAWRKQGITTRLMEVLAETLPARGVKQYLLEVIKTNTPAYNLYLKQGFAVNREFDCYRTAKKDIKVGIAHAVRYFQGDFEMDGHTAGPMWDYHPSWQNSLDSIAAIQNETVAAAVYSEGKIAGYGIIHAKTGGVSQLAIDRNCRNRGVGRSLLAALAGKTEAEIISFINVDSECTSMKGFLGAMGFHLEVQQYEMVKKLG